MAPVLERKSIGSNQKPMLEGELLIWRTQNQARDQSTLQLKDSICFKLVQICSRKLDSGPSSKVGLLTLTLNVFIKGRFNTYESLDI
jgi:hypothetical protein